MASGVMSMWLRRLLVCGCGGSEYVAAGVMSMWLRGL